MTAAEIPQPHPAAEIFPLMSGADFDALVADIRENGQREPIILHDGLILDGRNRARACEAIGILPRTVAWDGPGTPDAFVISMNLHRRHLSESQRGLIAARLANVKNGEVGRGHEKSGRQICLPEAAKLLNVSVGTVQHAKKVLSEGTSEEIAAVERGDAAASTIAKQINTGLPPAKRKAAREASMAHAGKNPERIQRAQMQADIWAKLGGALDALVALPLPADVADIVNKSPNRRRSVDGKLARSLQWLKDFADACRRD